MDSLRLKEKKKLSQNKSDGNSNSNSNNNKAAFNTINSYYMYGLVMLTTTNHGRYIIT